MRTANCTASQFSAFAPGADGGIYFTNLRDEAEEFALLQASGKPHAQARILEVSLTYGRPLEVDYAGAVVTDRVKRRIERDIARAKKKGHDALVIRNIDNFDLLLSDTHIVFSDSVIADVTSQII